ncbi:member of the karyopherin-beta [Cladophialophora chaetospira]|uniref:Member of the karyopherin-beta n=1 Tax=Cladophialophora chaetospira TaxID=386627 RepID=A0AA38XFU1_9EURO|nr:member of the karyopherin-beta [Cladophialophora chaetospira]
MEHLIVQLYDPANQSSPDRINEVQAQIQRLQRERSAWQLGLDLLHHREATVRFYGALTLTIKINADWDLDGLGKDEQMRLYLLEALVSNYVRLIDQQESNFVLQKLGSTIITYFAKTDSGWTFPVRHVLACMLGRHYVSEDSSPDANQLLGASQAVSANQLKGVLMLVSLIAEDLSNQSTTGLDEGRLNARIGANCLDVLHVLKYCSDLFRADRFSNTQEETLEGSRQHRVGTTSIDNAAAVPLLQLVFKAVPYWVGVIKHADTKDTLQLEGLAIDCIASSGDCLESKQLTAAVLQMIISLEQSSPRLLRQGSPEFPSIVVGSEKAKELMTSLLQGDFSPDAIVYVDLLDAIMSRVDTTKPDYLHDHWYQELARIMGRLLRCEGVAVIEDPVCHIVLQRITEMAEGSTDWEELNDPGMAILRGLTADACDACLLKIRIPDGQMSSETQDWDADDRARFRDFRYDVHDFFQSALTVLGNELVEEVVKTVVGQEMPPDWGTFEAGVFCLVALFDALSADTDPYVALITAVLNSSSWEYLLQLTSSVPDRALQTAINFLAENVTHLQRRPDKLVPILNFLFSSLHLKASATAASRAIFKLCDSHRELLREGLPQFMGSLASIEKVGDAERHRIYGAVAALVQALPSEEAKVQPLTQLLLPISQELASLEGSNADHDEILKACTDIVQTLASIGKGMRSPADAPVDLEAPSTHVSNFWTTGPGATVQQKLLGVYHAALQNVQINIDNVIVDACCDFLRSGFTETHPSPFKFSDAIGLELMIDFINVDNPSIDNTMACATSYLAAVSSQSIQSSIGGILYAVVSNEQHILTQLQSTRQLPNSNFASASLEFLGRCFAKWGKLWFDMQDSQEAAAVAMELGLIVMADADTLPRRSAAAFFAAFADFTDPGTGIAGDAKVRMRNVLDAFGPRVLSLLLRLLGGECARSELESLSETLKKFIQKQPKLTKAIFREAIRAESGVMTEKALKATTIEQRNRFVAQIEVLRGARKTNEAVKDFWIACRGSGFGYIA